MADDSIRGSPMSNPPMPNSPLLWVEPGEQREGLVARVALQKPVHRLYSYAVPDAFADLLRPGRGVLIPFGKEDRAVVAFCGKVSRGPWTSSLKEVLEVIDPQPLLSEKLLELGHWTSTYYACPLGRTLASMVPQAVRQQSGFRTVRTLTAMVSLEEAAASGRLGAKQRALLEQLADGPMEVKRLAALGIRSAVVRSAEKKGLVCVAADRVPRPGPDFDRPLVVPDYELNKDQQAALRRMAQVLDAGRFRVVLLYGVGGSGKTEVYRRSIPRGLAAGALLP